MKKKKKKAERKKLYVPFSLSSQFIFLYFAPKKLEKGCCTDIFGEKMKLESKIERITPFYTIPHFICCFQFYTIKTS